MIDEHISSMRSTERGRPSARDIAFRHPTILFVSSVEVSSEEASDLHTASSEDMMFSMWQLSMASMIGSVSERILLMGVASNVPFSSARARDAAIWDLSTSPFRTRSSSGMSILKSFQDSTGMPVHRVLWIEMC